jgi:hypothetical protein
LDSPTSLAATTSKLYNFNRSAPANYSWLPNPARIPRDDYSSALLFLREGKSPQTAPRSSPALLPLPLLTCPQVIGDLWERYLKLIDEGMPDG